MKKFSTLLVVVGFFFSFLILPTALFAGGVDRDNAHTAIFAAQCPHQGVDQTRFAGARRTGEPDSQCGVARITRTFGIVGAAFERREQLIGGLSLRGTFVFDEIQRFGDRGAISGPEPARKLNRHA